MCKCLYAGVLLALEVTYNNTINKENKNLRTINMWPKQSYKWVAAT